MDVIILQGLIESVGFPIAVCIALFYQNYKTQEAYNKTFSEFKDVINQNSSSLVKLTELVNEIKKEGNK